MITKKDLLSVEYKLNKCYGILKRSDLKLDREQEAADLLNKIIDVAAPTTKEGDELLKQLRYAQAWLQRGYEEGRIK